MSSLQLFGSNSTAFLPRRGYLIVAQKRVHSNLYASKRLPVRIMDHLYEAKDDTTAFRYKQVATMAHFIYVQPAGVFICRYLSKKTYLAVQLVFWFDDCNFRNGYLTKLLSCFHLFLSL
jgi:hypothetical protein